MGIITNEGISYKPSLLDRITSKHIIEIYQKQEELFSDAVKIRAKPPIKGDITAGKLKWRGIKMVRRERGSETWLEQRGQRISGKLVMNLGYYLSKTGKSNN